jgi:lysophospholipase L1-like esterase
LGRKSRSKRETRAPAPVEARPESAEDARRRTPRWLLWSIVLALPIVLLAALEVGLRATGFGHNLEPLFVPSPEHPEYLQANPRVVTRFFTDSSQAPSVSIETAYFPAVKAPGTFRVFVQGGSSAAGFPYGLGAALAGVLDQRLERAFPDREIEVVSTAMAAVNSYALLDFADEIIARQPDAVVVYAGHNEFLGILGVGSTMRLAASPAVTRAFLAARDWRLFQLLSRAYAGLRPTPEQSTGQGDSLMARVAGERSIALNSELYARGVEQFETNLDALLGRYRAAGIPVLIGTLASNERDQPPLAILAGVESDAAGAARTAYHAAQDAEEAGQFDAAREGYAWARDLDPLRFRGPSVFNQAIERVAAKHGAILVDVHGAFVEASPHGLVGNGLMLEHVHPNLDGYFRMADAFFKAMTANGLPGSPEVEVTDDAARADLPVSDIDRYLGDYKVLRIKAGWPFSTGGDWPQLPPAGTEPERLAQQLYQEQISWPQAQEALRQYYAAAGDRAGYAHVTWILADAFPFAGPLQFQAAAALIELGRAAEAVRYSRRGTVLEPRDVNQWLVHAHGLLLTGHDEDGRAALHRALELEPGNPTARSVLEQLGEPGTDPGP